jgi:hypothetical protein
LGASRVSLIVIVNESAPLTTVPVPEAPLAFCATIGKTMSAGIGVALVSAPQAAAERMPMIATRKIFTPD